MNPMPLDPLMRSLDAPLPAVPDRHAFPAGESLGLVAAIPLLLDVRGGTLALPVSGTSMEPTLREGDRVIVGPLGRDRLRTGDLFLYRGENRLVVHRFLGSRTFAGGQRLLCQRGDNLEGWGWVSQKAVLGRVLSIEHGERTFQMEAFPWTWLNPLIGGWGRLWVGIAELSRFGGKLLPHRPERARIATVFLGRAVHRTLFGIARRALRVLVGGR